MIRRLMSQSSTALGGAVHPGGPVPGRNRPTSSAKAALLALVAALSLLSSIAASFAQVPAPVPALPDSERRTAYTITASQCNCAVNFQLFGDSNDFQNWVEVWLNGTRLNFNDPTFGWTITSPTGPIGNIARPITDAVLTFANQQTGTVQIVGARRPRRASQFSENQGVSARNLNQVITDIVAMLREVWDKINDVTGRTVQAPPGETLSVLPPISGRANMGVCFDSGGNIVPCVGSSAGSFAAGDGITFTGTGPTTISTNAASLPSTFDTAFCNTVGFVIVRLTGAWACDNSIPASVKWFGATGNGTTDDSAAFQATETAMEAIGGTMYIPPGSYKIGTAINITGHIVVNGSGFQTTSTNYGFGSTTPGFDTRASGFHASVIICGVANSAFNVATTDSIVLQNFQVTYPAVGNSGVAALNLGTAAGGATGANINSVVKDVMINGAGVGIHVQDWIQFEFNNLYHTFNTIDIIAENTVGINANGVTTAASAGDSKIINSTFYDTQGNQAILIESGAGYRIINNKFNGANGGLPNAAAIQISPQNLGVPFSLTPGLINDNSIEGFGIGVSFAPNASSQGQLSLWTISGNEFFNTIGIDMSAGSAIPTWMDGVSITGNAFTYGQNGSIAPCIVLAGVKDAVISSNVFAGASPSNQLAVSFGTAISNIKVASNVYAGSAKPPGFVTPAVPATGVGVTNTSAYSVTVNVNGGTVSQVQIAPALSGGFTGVAGASPSSVILNPGDQIILNYSAAPTWQWTTINP
jgi:Pectate lyase superfamily protein